MVQGLIQCTSGKAGFSEEGSKLAMDTHPAQLTFIPATAWLLLNTDRLTA